MSIRRTFGPLTANGSTTWQQLDDGEGIVAIEGTTFGGGTAKLEFARAEGAVPLAQNTELQVTAKTPLHRIRGSSALWARLTLSGATGTTDVSAFIDI